jgi:dihydrofolate reductase
MIGKMKTIAISAVALDGTIGVGNEIPWNVPEDFKHYKKLTQNNKIIIGDKTFVNLPAKAKENRHYFVLSQDGEYINNFINGGILSTKSFQNVYSSIDELFDTLSTNKNYENDIVYVAGGAMIYDTLIDYCDEAVITWINKTYENGDKKFPIDKLFADFEVIIDSDWQMSKSNIQYKIVYYRRSNGS